MIFPDFDKLWNYQQPNETQQTFEKLYAQFIEADNPEWKAQLVTQIARTQGLQRKFDDAHNTLEKAKEMVTTETPVAELRYLIERGRVHNSSGNKLEAKKYFEECFKLAEERGFDYLAVDAAHMMGIVEEPDVALQWNERAVEIAESSAYERAHNWLGALYNNIGWTYAGKEEYETAQQWFIKCRGWYSKKGLQRQTDIARWCIAKMDRLMGHTQKSLEQQLTLEVEGKADGYTMEEIGECYYALDKQKEAKPYFAKAHAELSKDIWLESNEPERLARLKLLGGIT